MSLIPDTTPRPWLALPGATVGPTDAISVQLDCIIGDSEYRRLQWESERRGRILCDSCGTSPVISGRQVLCRGCTAAARMRNTNRRRIVAAKRRERNKVLRNAAKRAVAAFERGSIEAVASAMDALKRATKEAA